MTAESYVWLNGKFQAAEEARVSLFDRGYLYGDGLFETMRAYQGQIFRLQQHFDRLAAGAAALGIELPYSCREIRHTIGNLLQANLLTEAYLRLTLSRGAGLGPLPPEQPKPTVSLIARPLRLPAPEEYEAGWGAVVVESALAPGAQLSGLKSLCYLDKLMAKASAQAAGVQEALLVNARGEVTEASSSNVFIVRDKRLLTPPREAGLLAGITRGVVMELAPALSLQVEERRLTPEEVLGASEAFLTNSIMEIMPLVRLGGNSIGEGRPGPVARALQQSYQSLMRRELELPMGDE